MDTWSPSRWLPNGISGQLCQQHCGDAQDMAALRRRRALGNGVKSVRRQVLVGDGQRRTCRARATLRRTSFAWSSQTLLPSPAASSLALGDGKQLYVATVGIARATPWLRALPVTLRPNFDLLAGSMDRPSIALGVGAISCSRALGCKQCTFDFRGERRSQLFALPHGGFVQATAPLQGRGRRRLSTVLSAVRSIASGTPCSECIAGEAGSSANAPAQRHAGAVRVTVGSNATRSRRRRAALVGKVIPGMRTPGRPGMSVLEQQLLTHALPSHCAALGSTGHRAAELANMLAVLAGANCKAIAQLPTKQRGAERRPPTRRAGAGAAPIAQRLFHRLPAAPSIPCRGAAAAAAFQGGATAQLGTGVHERLFGQQRGRPQEARLQPLHQSVMLRAPVAASRSRLTRRHNRREALARARGHLAAAKPGASLLQGVLGSSKSISAMMMLHGRGRCADPVGGFTDFQAPVVCAMLGGADGGMRQGILDLRNTKRYNPLDQQLVRGIVFGISAIMAAEPLGLSLLTVQATGPHFCTGGGAPEPQVPGHEQRASLNTLVAQLVLGAGRLAEASIVQAASLKGAVVGGGLALALTMTRRAVVPGCTMSFGNLSRGVSPLLLLSRTLPQIAGHVAATSLYLEDGILDAASACRLGIADEIVSSAARNPHAIHAQLLTSRSSAAAVAQLRMRACTELVDEIIGHVSTLLVHADSGDASTSEEDVAKVPSFQVDHSAVPCGADICLTTSKEQEPSFQKVRHQAAVQPTAAAAAAPATPSPGMQAAVAVGAAPLSMSATRSFSAPVEVDIMPQQSAGLRAAVAEGPATRRSTNVIGRFLCGLSSCCSFGGPQGMSLDMIQVCSPRSAQSVAAALRTAAMSSNPRVQQGTQDNLARLPAFANGLVVARVVSRGGAESIGAWSAAPLPHSAGGRRAGSLQLRGTAPVSIPAAGVPVMTPAVLMPRMPGGSVVLPAPRRTVDAKAGAVNLPRSLLLGGPSLALGLTMESEPRRPLDTDAAKASDSRSPDATLARASELSRAILPRLMSTVFNQTVATEHDAPLAGDSLQRLLARMVGVGHSLHRHENGAWPEIHSDFGRAAARSIMARLFGEHAPRHSPENKDAAAAPHLRADAAGAAVSQRATPTEEWKMPDYIVDFPDQPPAAATSTSGPASVSEGAAARSQRKTYHAHTAMEVPEIAWLLLGASDVRCGVKPLQPSCCATGPPALPLHNQASISTHLVGDLVSASAGLPVLRAALLGNSTPTIARGASATAAAVVAAGTAAHIKLDFAAAIPAAQGLAMAKTMGSAEHDILVLLASQALSEFGGFTARFAEAGNLARGSTSGHTTFVVRIAQHGATRSRSKVQELHRAYSQIYFEHMRCSSMVQVVSSRHYASGLRRSYDATRRLRCVCAAAQLPHNVVSRRGSVSVALRGFTRAEAMAAVVASGHWVSIDDCLRNKLALGRNSLAIKHQSVGRPLGADRRSTAPCSTTLGRHEFRGAPAIDYSVLSAFYLDTCALPPPHGIGAASWLNPPGASRLIPPALLGPAVLLSIHVRSSAALDLADSAITEQAAVITVSQCFEQVHCAISSSSVAIASGLSCSVTPACRRQALITKPPKEDPVSTSAGSPPLSVGLPAIPTPKSARGNDVAGAAMGTAAHIKFCPPRAIAAAQELVTTKMAGSAEHDVLVLSAAQALSQLSGFAARIAEAGNLARGYPSWHAIVMVRMAPQDLSGSRSDLSMLQRMNLQLDFTQMRRSSSVQTVSSRHYASGLRRRCNTVRCFPLVCAAAQRCHSVTLAIKDHSVGRPLGADQRTITPSATTLGGHVLPGMAKAHLRSLPLAIAVPSAAAGVDRPPVASQASWKLREHTAGAKQPIFRLPRRNRDHSEHDLCLLAYTTRRPARVVRFPAGRCACACNLDETLRQSRLASSVDVLAARTSQVIRPELPACDAEPHRQNCDHSGAPVRCAPQQRGATGGALELMRAQLRQVQVITDASFARVCRALPPLRMPSRVRPQPLTANRERDVFHRLPERRGATVKPTVARSAGAQLLGVGGDFSPARGDVETGIRIVALSRQLVLLRSFDSRRAHADGAARRAGCSGGEVQRRACSLRRTWVLTTGRATAPSSSSTVAAIMAVPRRLLCLRAQSFDLVAARSALTMCRAAPKASPTSWQPGARRMHGQAPGAVQSLVALRSLSSELLGKSFSVPLSPGGGFATQPLLTEGRAGRSTERGAEHLPAAAEARLLQSALRRITTYDISCCSDGDVECTPLPLAAGNSRQPVVTCWHRCSSLQNSSRARVAVVAMPCSRQATDTQAHHPLAASQKLRRLGHVSTLEHLHPQAQQAQPMDTWSPSRWLPSCLSGQLCQQQYHGGAHELAACQQRSALGNGTKNVGRQVLTGQGKRPARPAKATLKRTSFAWSSQTHLPSPAASSPAFGDGKQLYVAAVGVTRATPWLRVLPVAMRLNLDLLAGGLDRPGSALGVGVIRRSGAGGGQQFPLDVRRERRSQHLVLPHGGHAQAAMPLQGRGQRSLNAVLSAVRSIASGASGAAPSAACVGQAANPGGGSANVPAQRSAVAVRITTGSSETRTHRRRIAWAGKVIPGMRTPSRPGIRLMKQRLLAHTPPSQCAALGANGRRTDDLANMLAVLAESASLVGEHHRDPSKNRKAVTQPPTEQRSAGRRLPMRRRGAGAPLVAQRLFRHLPAASSTPCHGAAATTLQVKTDFNESFFGQQKGNLQEARLQLLHQSAMLTTSGAASQSRLTHRHSRREALARARGRSAVAHRGASPLLQGALSSSRSISAMMLLHGRGRCANPIGGSTDFQAPVVCAMLGQAEDGMRQGILDLRNTKRYNPLDQQLVRGIVFGISAILAAEPLGLSLLTVQATGPHFCTGGGAPEPPVPGHEQRASPNTLVAQLVLGAGRLAEASIVQAATLKGAVVGGGLALALTMTRRAVVPGCTMAFGNLSRGVSPLLLLSRTLPHIAGHVAATSLYLEDGILDAASARRLGIADEIVCSAARNPHGIHAQLLTSRSSVAAVAQLRMRACNELVDEIISHVSTLVYEEPGDAAASEEQLVKVPSAEIETVAVPRSTATSVKTSQVQEPALQTDRQYEAAPSVTAAAASPAQQSAGVRAVVAEAAVAAPPPMPVAAAFAVPVEVDIMPQHSEVLRPAVLEGPATRRSTNVLGRFLCGLSSGCSFGGPQGIAVDMVQVCSQRSSQAVASALRAVATSSNSRTQPEAQTNLAGLPVFANGMVVARVESRGPPAQGGTQSIGAWSAAPLLPLSADDRRRFGPPQFRGAAPESGSPKVMPVRTPAVLMPRMSGGSVVLPVPRRAVDATVGATALFCSLLFGGPSLAVGMTMESRRRWPFDTDAVQASDSRGSDATGARASELSRAILPRLMAAVFHHNLAAAHDVPLAGDCLQLLVRSIAGAGHSMHGNAFGAWPAFHTDLGRAAARSITTRLVGELVSRSSPEHKVAPAADLPVGAVGNAVSQMPAPTEEWKMPDYLVDFPDQFPTAATQPTGPSSIAEGVATRVRGTVCHTTTMEVPEIAWLLLGASDIMRDVKPLQPSLCAVGPATLPLREEATVRRTLASQACCLEHVPLLRQLVQPLRLIASSAAIAVARPPLGIVPGMAAAEDRSLDAAVVQRIGGISVGIHDFVFARIPSGDGEAPPQERVAGTAQRQRSCVRFLWHRPVAKAGPVPVVRRVVERALVNESGHDPFGDSLRRQRVARCALMACRSFSTLSFSSVASTTQSSSLRSFTTIFAVHGADGDFAGATWSTLRRLSRYQVVSLTYDTAAFLSESLVDLATLYAGRISSQRPGPDAPVALAAHSLGCVIAHHMAAEAGRRGWNLIGVALIDMQVLGIPPTSVPGDWMALKLQGAVGDMPFSTRPVSVVPLQRRQLCQHRGSQGWPGPAAAVAPTWDRLIDFAQRHQCSSAFRAFPAGAAYTAMLVLAPSSAGIHNAVEVNSKYHESLSVVQGEGDHFRCVLAHSVADVIHTFMRRALREARCSGDGPTDVAEVHAGHVALQRRCSPWTSPSPPIRQLSCSTVRLQVLHESDRKVFPSKHKMDFLQGFDAI